MDGRVYFDGGVRLTAGGQFCLYSGWVASLDGREVASGNAAAFEDADITGSCNAEFSALLHALTAARQSVVGADQVLVMGDSRSVIDLCSGASHPGSPWVKRTLALIHNQTELYAPSEVVFKWIPRGLNGTADRLGKQAFAEASGQQERISLMNRVNALSRRNFGEFYHRDIVSEWAGSVTGKRKLSSMSIAELHLMIRRARDIPEFIRDHVARCNTAAQSVSA